MIQIDMPMPDNCVECRFSQGEYGFCYAMPPNFTGYVNDFEEDGRTEWCPLKEQRPRVMSFDELHAVPERTVVWLEMKDVKEIEPFIWAGNGWYSPYFSCVATPLCQELYWQDESSVCRAWTSRPTDEQREAVKWDG